jgi:PleD family two-component response regulator
MPADLSRRRVLLVDRPAAMPALRHLFSRHPLDRWEPVEADSLAQARVLVQHSPFDVLVVGEELYHKEGEPASAWVGGQERAAMLLLSGGLPDAMAQAYGDGVSLCLERQTALGYPSLLSAALEQVACRGDTGRRHRQTEDQLSQCRGQVDRLVRLMWRSAPLEPATNWYTQRFTMERLDEEIARSERHGGPLALAVAEVQAEAGEADLKLPAVEEWTSEVVGRAKRRCDVAGQYGMQGFLLLMVDTSKNGAILCCRRLKKLLEAGQGNALGPRGPIRAYFGIASARGDVPSTHGLLRHAEQNLEAAKAGTNGGVVAD